MSKQRIFVLAAAIVGIISAFVPWAYISIPALKMKESGGNILVFLLLIAPVILVFVGDRKSILETKKQITCLILASLTVLWSLYKIAAFDSELKAALELAKTMGARTLKISGSLGAGPFVALLASIALIAGIFIGKKLSSKAA